MRRWPIVIILLLLAVPALSQEPPKQDLRFGIRVAPEQWGALDAALAAEPCDPANPVGVTLELPAAWTQKPDWDAFAQALDAAVKAHARVCVATGIPGDANDPSASAYLAELSRRAGEAADTLSLSLAPDRFAAALQGEPDEVALTLKRLISALRGSSRATVLVGEVSQEALPLMEPLYERDFRAYVEGYSSDATGAMGEPDDAVVRFLDAHHLGAPLLVHLPRAESAIASQLLVLLAATRGVSFMDVEPGDVAVSWHALSVLRGRMTPAMGAGYAVMATEIRDASGPRSDVAILNLLDADRMIQGMALVPVTAASPTGQLEIHLPTGDVTDPVAYPLPEGAAVELGYTADQKKGETVLRVPWQGKAQLVLFSRLKTGTVGEGKITVSTVYRIPVEVIIARYQAAQQPQDVFLNDYSAAATVDYHFKLPGGTGSLDVTFLDTFLYEKGVGARWVQNQMLLNGVAWKGKKIPALPIIEPEKVNTLPLALTLGRDYSYRYLRDERAEGHDCYVVEFIPLPGAKGSLYSGKMWIDKQTYRKIKMSVRQTGLQPPQVSNDETDYFAPFKGPDGHTYWLLARLEGQQIFSVGGVNFAAERSIRFDDLKLNDPGFRQEVAKAEASDKLILQDTDKGLRYLEKQKDGTRKLEMEPKSGRWFAVGGAYYDKSLDYPLPLIGANYFDYDWRKTHTQVNLFLAGAVNTLTLAKVDFFPKVDASANAVLFTFPTQDRFYAPEGTTGVESGTELEGQRIKILREYANAGLGWRFTEMSKLSLDVGLMYYHYSRVSQTAPGFALPPNHFDTSLGLTYSYSRRGWSLSADYEGHHRSTWDPWGFMAPGTDVSSKRNYALWEASFAKSFYLPYFQKISAGVTWMGGKDLDRFSKYQFSYLGTKTLSGFAGSGVRFDEGALARLSYDFSLAKVVRFGFEVDQAHVKPNKDVDLWQNHTGLGLTGAVTGPWQTYWTVDLGYALKSDIPAVQHDYTAALVVLKVW